MQSKKLKKLVIFCDPTKGKTGTIVNKFLKSIAGKAEVLANCSIDRCTVGCLHEADFAVVFGGDGSIISAAKSLSETNVPVIGVNLGRLGFLAEFSADELQQYFDDIIAGKGRVEKRMMLDCEVLCGGRKEFSSQAVNEIFITSGPPFKMIELKIAVDGQHLASCVSDGLLIATPTGSTAYNLSAGGPILSGKIDAMVITSICPHSLSFRPIVIHADSKIEIDAVKVNDGTTVSVDGQIQKKFYENDRIVVCRSKSRFLIVNNPLRTQWDSLATKLNWAEKPRYNS